MVNSDAGQLQVVDPGLHVGFWQMRVGGVFAAVVHMWGVDPGVVHIDDLRGVGKSVGAEIEVDVFGAGVRVIWQRHHLLSVCL